MAIELEQDNIGRSIQ